MFAHFCLGMFSNIETSSDVGCTVPRVPARSLLTRETYASCVRKHLQCSVKQELLQHRLQQAGERGRLWREVKRKWTGEREGKDRSKVTQSQTGERRRGLLAVGETKQERCETWYPQKCNANAEGLNQAMPKQERCETKLPQ